MEKINGKDREIGTASPAGAGAGTGAGDRSAAPTTAGAGTGTGTGAGTGTGTGAGTGTGTGKTKEKEPVEVAIIVPEEKPKRKKRAPSKKKVEEKGVKTDDVAKLIVSVSGIVASRPNQQHWKISDKEAKQIAEPLTNIIEQSEIFSKLAEHSDSLALVTACVTVFAPRVMISYVQIKNEKELKKHGYINKTSRTAGNKSGNKSGASRGDNAGDAGRDATGAPDDTILDASIYAATDIIV